MQDLLAAQVGVSFAGVPNVLGHVRAGKLKGIAVTTEKRMAALPNVPTVAESGYPGYSATNWYAFVASSKVPKPILERWNTELVKVLKAPEVVKELDHHGLTPQPGTREELAQDIARESATWGRVVRERKITLQ
jgi:tripartite-type tricarboxylate transporter receptor subunit TctC